MPVEIIRRAFITSRHHCFGGGSVSCRTSAVSNGFCGGMSFHFHWLPPMAWRGPAVSAQRPGKSLAWTRVKKGRQGGLPRSEDRESRDLADLELFWRNRKLAPIRARITPSFSRPTPA
jgi:hypothetical protein